MVLWNASSHKSFPEILIDVERCRRWCQANADSLSLPAGQLFGEQDVTQLGLGIRSHATVLSMPEVQVIDIKAAMPVHC